MAITMSIKRLVTSFKDTFRGIDANMSFVKYIGDRCIDVFLIDGTRMRYSYDARMLIEVENDCHWMEWYEHPAYPLPEKHYILTNAELIRGRMDALGISHRELARKANLSERGLSKILEGTVCPSSYTLYILEKCLWNSDCDPWHLL